MPCQELGATLNPCAFAGTACGMAPHSHTGLRSPRQAAVGGAAVWPSKPSITSQHVWFGFISESQESQTDSLDLGSTAAHGL